jgi:hypothetical protein
LWQTFHYKKQLLGNPPNRQVKEAFSQHLIYSTKYNWQVREITRGQVINLFDTLWADLIFGFPAIHNKDIFIIPRNDITA